MELHQLQTLLHRKENNYRRIRNNHQRKQPEKTRKHQQIAGPVEEKKVIATIHRKNPNSKAN